MNLPLILADDPSIDLLHTLEFEVSDGGDILVTDAASDIVGQTTTYLEWPLDKAEAIAVALLRAAREAREQRALPLVLPIGLPAPGPQVGRGW